MNSQNLTQISDGNLFDELMDDLSVKTGEGYVPFASNLGIIDVSLRGRGRREDHLFANNEFYRKNVRRGLSFLEEDSKGIKILRRGLEKFFDLRSAYLRMLGGNFEDKLPADDEKLFHVIFDDVQETLDMGGTVTIYKTEKANGENAQIGYDENYDAWVVASKNVSMLIRNKQDIDDYAKCGDGRYAYAILIAYKWLELAVKIPDLKGFKEGLKNRTLIGEYCGKLLLKYCTIIMKRTSKTSAFGRVQGSDDLLFCNSGFLFRTVVLSRPDGSRLFQEIRVTDGEDN